MDPKVMTPRARLRALRQELVFWQMQVRTEMRWLAKSRANVKDIARKMRAVQKETKCTKK